MRSQKVITWLNVTQDAKQHTTYKASMASYKASMHCTKDFDYISWSNTAQYHIQLTNEKDRT